MPEVLECSELEDGYHVPKVYNRPCWINPKLDTQRHSVCGISCLICLEARPEGFFINDFAHSTGEELIDF